MKGIANHEQCQELPLFSQTSKAAAEAVAPKIGGQLALLLSAFRRAGIAGLTDQEAARATGLRDNSLRPRRVALERDGQIMRTNRRRATDTGCSALVFVAREFFTPGAGEGDR